MAGDGTRRLYEWLVTLRRGARLHGLALLVAVAGLAAIPLGSPPAAKAAPSLVTVRVTIGKVEAQDCFEGTFLGGCLGDPDFYAVVAIGDMEFPRTDAIDDQGTADPNPDWVFERQVDPTSGTVGVAIGIFEEDGGLRFNDDHADIDPTNGGDPFNLDLQVVTSPFCSVVGDATLTTDQCGTIRTSTGTADNRKARIFYKIEVIDPDSDGDWLPDSWENGGLNADSAGGIDVDLPSMGANPQRKDLFLEIDCLVDNDGTADDHSHCPLQGAVQSVVQAFADSPVGNLDGSTGIQLHVDVGSLYGQALNTDTKVLRTGAAPGGVTGTFGNYGGGGTQIPEAGNQIVDWDGATGSPATNFYSIKGSPTNAFNSNRALVFRYGLFVHQVNARAPSNDCTSGWGEGGVNSAGTNLPGNDFIVSLGGTGPPPPGGGAGAPCWGVDGGGNSVGSQTQQAGTLMHEFGHTLSLDHGGGDAFNNKPNYLSVMNYAISTGPAASPNTQFCNVPAIGGQPGGCDYSRVALPTLEERLNAGATPPQLGLDECAGIGLGLGGFDWDGVGGTTGTTCAPASANVSANVNGDFNDTNNNGTQDAGETTILSQLPGFDDWSNIRYDFRAQSDFGDGSVPPFRNEADPATLAALRASLAERIRPVLSVDKTGPANAIPGDTLNYGIEVRSTGRGPAFGTTLTDTKPDSTTVSFDLGLAPIGSSFDRSATYTVPCSTSDLTALTNSATARGEDLIGNLVTGSDSVQTTVHAPVLTLSKTATATVNAGEAITYRITYRNTGSGEAKSVVVTDTLPRDVYYSAALDTGAGTRPTTITRNGDGTTTLTWNVGSLAGNSAAATIEYTARPSLLFLGGSTIVNGATVTFTNGNGCTYTPVTSSGTTSITVVPPSQNPLTIGYWRNHPERWTGETLARIQATDQRFDGADGSLPDGALSFAELVVALGPSGTTQKLILAQQLLGTYFNLAERRINAGTAIASKTDRRLGLANVRDAALYGIATLALPAAGNADRYSDATLVLDEINMNKSEVY